MSRGRITPETGRLLPPRTGEESDVPVARLSDGALRDADVASVGQMVGGAAQSWFAEHYLSTKSARSTVFGERSTGFADLSAPSRPCTDSATDLASCYRAIDDAVIAALSTPEIAAAFAEANFGLKAISDAYVALHAARGHASGHARRTRNDRATRSE